MGNKKGGSEDPPYRKTNDYWRREVWVAVGKSFGTGWVTLPVAAHSAPRCNVAMKPTQERHATGASSLGLTWPSVVWKTRPLP